MTAIDRYTLIEAAAKAIFDVRDDEFDLDEWEDCRDPERWQCNAEAVVPVVVAAVLKPLRELVAEWRRDAVELQRELGPQSAAVACTLLDANALESLLDQIESDLAGGSHA